MKKTFITIILLIILTGCNNTTTQNYSIQKDCISDNCTIENCINDNLNSCETKEGESGDAIEKINKLNKKYPAYSCEWAMNNMSNLYVIDCYKK